MHRYVLHPACRVRREKFGLLFYDLRGPNLLFAETGDLLEAEDFAGRSLGPAALCSLASDKRETVERFLHCMVEKGFLREQPVC